MHAIRRTAAWVLSAERAPQAPQPGYDVMCVECEAESGHTVDDATPAELWAIDHTARHGRAHSQFAVWTQSYWTVHPRSGMPAYGPVWGPDTIVLNPLRPRAPAAHARRRARWRPGMLLTRLSRLGAPDLAVGGLIVASIVLALVLGAAPAVATG